MHLRTTPKSMWYQSPTRSSPMLQQKHHNRHHFGYKIHHHRSCMHEYMNHQQCIYSHKSLPIIGYKVFVVTNNRLQIYMKSLHSTSTFSMYEFNTSTINNHICHVIILHQHSTTPSSSIITQKKTLSRKIDIWGIKSKPSKRVQLPQQNTCTTPICS